MQFGSKAKNKMLEMREIFSPVMWKHFDKARTLNSLKQGAFEATKAKACGQGQAFPGHRCFLD